MGMATSLFEFWLSASFALAMVSYFVGGKLSSVMLKLVSIIYLTASAAFIFGWFAFSSQINEYMMMMEQQGYQTTHFNNIFGIFHGLGIISVFIIGTIGVLYYLRWVISDRSDSA